MVCMLIEFLSRFATKSDRLQWFFFDKIHHFIEDLGQDLGSRKKIAFFLRCPYSARDLLRVLVGMYNVGVGRQGY